MKQIIRLAIPGIKCNGCVSAIEKSLSNETGVITSEVDLETKTATVESTVPPVVLIDAVKTAGFDATELVNQDGVLPA